MKNALIILTFLVSVLFADITAHALTIPASEDSFGYNGQLTAAGNAAVQLAVDVNRKAFIYFNFFDIPTNAVVRWAKLRLFLPTVTAKGSGLSIYQVGGVWNECKASAMPFIQPYAVASIPADQLGSKRFVTADVTATVQNWISMKALNEGFAIAPTLGYYGTSSLMLTSKEGSSLGIPAELDIEFQPESKPLTVDQLPASLTSLLTPKIVAQPTLGYNGSISVGVQGIGNLTYQWYKNGVPVNGGTSANLSLDGLTSGTYTLRTSNGFASSLSSSVSFNSNNYIPNFSLIPAGTFQMGDNLDGNPDAPVHNVYVSQFFMAQTELTYGEWRNVKQWADAHGYQFDNAGAGNGDNYPVTNVNWYDAVKWCNAKSEMEGLVPCYYNNPSQIGSAIYRVGDVDITNEMVDWAANGYRMPTEAEWEKAARGGLGGYNPLEPNASSQQENVNNPSGTVPVKSHLANSYGLYGIGGNVYEWCWNWFSTYNGYDINPKGGNGYYRILRGTSFENPSPLSLGYRGWTFPNYTNHAIGFRLARTSKALNPRDITSGLVAYYPFNGNANDTSGNGFGGTVVGAALANDRFGNSNRCFEFNGSDNYIETSAQFPSGNTPKSFSFWFNPSMLKRGWMLSGGLDYDGQAFGAFFESANGSLVFHGNGGNADLALGNLTLTDKWSHIAVTYDGLNLRGYINGLLTAQREVALQTSLSNIKIGCRQNPLGEALGDAFFKGKLDDVRIYNRALTAKEVAALYNSEAPVQITAQPAIYPDGTLLAKAEGGEVSYQWFKNGIPISGGTSASLPLASGSLASGTYTLRASNRLSSLTSGSLQYNPTANPNFHDLVPVAGTNVAFSRYETTVGQWKRFVAETGWNKSDDWKTPIHYRTGTNFTQTDSEPVVSVNSQDAQDYCAWLTQKTGKIWRLPTDQEWKIAAGPDQFPWGSYFPPLPTDGNYWNASASSDGYSNTAPVGQYKANRAGLSDMGGNAWEWVHAPSDYAVAGAAYDNDSTQGELFTTNNVNFYVGPLDRNGSVGFRVVRELPPDIISGLVAYYPFNGNAKDTSGGGNDGIAYSLEPCADRAGVSGKAYRFNGTSSYIDLSAINSLGLGKPNSQFSVSVWCKPESQGGTIISDYGGSVSGGDDIFAVAVQATSGQFELSSRHYSMGLAYTDFVGQTTDANTMWTQLVYTMDGKGFCCVYQNGTLMSSLPYNPNLNYCDNPSWQIGRILFAGEQQFFTGFVDDVRIYKRTLTAKDAAALYDSEK